FVALADALNRLKKTGAVGKIPLKDFVAATSVGLVDTTPMLDLVYEEDSQAEVDMNVVMTASGEFIEIQGTAEKATFDKTQMNMLLELAEKGIKELIAYQKNLLKDIVWEKA
ncbi:MAG: ribonuclease PH, partial [Candidatus Omnitrophica bacterium]|nr:ribonuclease PH [Candidatus Omnitrophota bacterium]